ncbi:MAG: hypothetical protein Q7S79_01775 [bacterium]|nr:hypothetical protein [bacterium]
MAYLEQLLGAGAMRFNGAELSAGHEAEELYSTYRAFIVRHAEPEQYAFVTAPLSPEGRAKARIFPRRFATDFAVDPLRRRLVCLRQSGRNRTRESAEETYLGFQEMIQELGLANTVVLLPVEDPELLTTAPFQILMEKYNVPRELLQDTWEAFSSDELHERAVPTAREVGEHMLRKILRNAALLQKKRPAFEVWDFWFTHETAHIGILRLDSPGESFKIGYLEIIEAYRDLVSGRVMKTFRGTSGLLPSPSDN